MLNNVVIIQNKNNVHMYLHHFKEVNNNYVDGIIINVLILIQLHF